ncbi:helix-turn-helix transcriptional regulator [Streptomyces sp. NPDC088194]|uniref:helix-turn-helix domain-containing protein n=1 Tax=Streptomyces sp. NPDC088194 TaxID=3154931 RepID=UPI00344D9956
MDVRRLATQLRRMKDRSGLTVPALAARTAQPVETWERVLAGRQLPPLDAVEVLAQASGADYARVGELWRLAEKASTGTGDRGRGKAVPHPDPLDPLGAEEGLPGRRRQFLLLATVALLAVGALTAVLLTAGPSTGRAPAGQADPSLTAPAAPGASAPAQGHGSGGTPRSPGPGGTATAGTGDQNPGGVDQPLTGGGEPSASGAGPNGSRGSAGSAGSAGTSATGTPGGSGAPATTPPAGGANGGAGSGTATGGGSADPPSAPPTSAGPTPDPSPSHSPFCLGLILLGVCVG